MAAVSKTPWAFGHKTGQFKDVKVNVLAGEPDEAISVSADSSVSEEGNIAKAARLEEPGRVHWGPPSEASLEAIRYPPSPAAWTSHDSAALYNVPGWSEGYFEVAKEGHLAVKPRGEVGPSLDLHNLVNQLEAAGLRTPLVLRFPDILGDRVDRLNAAFSSVIRHSGYPAGFRGVFPVKCNHERDVVAAMVEFGRSHGFGLEVGSKAELVLAAAVLAEVDAADTLLVCNGYKDAEYMELAMRCAQLGPHVIIVMEQPEEVELAVRAALQVPGSPATLGIRAKLGTVHEGHWGSTSGEAAKFGLAPRQIIRAMATLCTAGLLPRLELLHFHVGSQMSALAEVRDALAEGAALYAELAKLGTTGLRFLDVGGGLAIDYDGSASDGHTSRGYGLSEYAGAVVSTVGEACAQRGVAPPTLISESGRALASHHAVVVFDVLGNAHEQQNSHDSEASDGNSSNSCSSSFVQPPPAAAATLQSPLLRFSLATPTSPSPGATAVTATQSSPSSVNAAFLLEAMRRVLSEMGLSPPTVRSALRDAAYFKDAALRAFKVGLVSLQERAEVDELAEAVGAKARTALASEKPPAVRALHVNLSVFKSAIDCWAIGQVFPIVPLSRLDEEPEVQAVLADLTCDSDGKIDTFINPNGGPPLRSLPLHRPRPAEPYRLAMFLTGVYQETMGCSHNMFGSLNAATVRLRRSTIPEVASATSMCSDAAAEAPAETTIATSAAAETFLVERMQAGENVETVLSRAGHDGQSMMRSLHNMAATAVAAQRLEPAQAEAAIECVTRRMQGYTYMLNTLC